MRTLGRMGGHAHPGDAGAWLQTRCASQGTGLGSPPRQAMPSPRSGGRWSWRGRRAAGSAAAVVDLGVHGRRQPLARARRRAGWRPPSRPSGRGSPRSRTRCGARRCSCRAPTSGWSAGSGSGSVTSSAAARITPVRSASTRASVSTTGPRAVFTRIADGFIDRSAAASMRWRVSAVRLTLSDTKSDCGEQLGERQPASRPSRARRPRRPGGGRGTGRASRSPPPGGPPPARCARSPRCPASPRGRRGRAAAAGPRSATGRRGRTGRPRRRAARRRAAAPTRGPRSSR